MSACNDPLFVEFNDVVEREINDFIEYLDHFLRRKKMNKTDIFPDMWGAEERFWDTVYEREDHYLLKEENEGYPGGWDTFTQQFWGDWYVFIWSFMCEARYSGDKTFPFPGDSDIEDLVKSFLTLSRVMGNECRAFGRILTLE